MTIAFNFTVVARNSHFNGITSFVIGTGDNEDIFRLADGTVDGTLLRTYTLADPEVQIGDTVSTLSGSIIMLKNPADPVPPDIYNITIGAVAVGVADDGQLILEQTETLGLISVPYYYSEFLYYVFKYCSMYGQLHLSLKMLQPGRCPGSGRGCLSIPQSSCG